MDIFCLCFVTDHTLHPEQRACPLNDRVVRRQLGVHLPRAGGGGEGERGRTQTTREDSKLLRLARKPRTHRQIDQMEPHAQHQGHALLVKGALLAAAQVDDDPLRPAVAHDEDDR